MKKEEQEIIRLLKQGDESAYKYIYKRHYSLLCVVAFEYLKDDFLAESIVNELIFHLWEKRETLEINTSLRSYLVRAVRNRCINYLNLEREQREIAFSSAGAGESEIIRSSESSEYPLAVLLAEELEEKISRSVARLPAESRKVFMMSKFEDKSYEQIADELAISINTVKYHMKKSFVLLKNDLMEFLHLS